MICQVQDVCRWNSMNMTTVVDDVYSQSGGRGHKWLCSYSLCQVDGNIEDA